MKPLKVFYMTSKFLNPRSIGPDPHSRSGAKKFKKKGMMPVYNNLFLGQELYFDVDFKMDSFDDSATMTKRVVQWVCEKFSITPEDLTIVFSGGKGFHVIWYGWNMADHAPQRFQDTYHSLMTRQRGGYVSPQLQKLHRLVKTEYIEELKERKSSSITRLPVTPGESSDSLVRIITKADGVPSFATKTLTASLRLSQFGER